MENTSVSLKSSTISMSFIDIEERLVFSRKYHFNRTNVAIHIVCIPIILFTAIAYLNRFQLSSPYLNGGSILALGYSIYYVLLDFKLGLITFPILNGIAYALTELWQFSKQNSPPDFTSTTFSRYALALHVFSWLAQFYGHGVYEKSKPALFDSLADAITLAPFFVVFEAAFALGYKPELQKRMNNRAGKFVRDQKLKKKN